MNRQVVAKTSHAVWRVSLRQTTTRLPASQASFFSSSSLRQIQLQTRTTRLAEEWVVAAAYRFRLPTVAAICYRSVRSSPIRQILGQLCLLVKTGPVNLPRHVTRRLQRCVDATAGIHVRTCRAIAIRDARVALVTKCVRHNIPSQCHDWTQGCACRQLCHRFLLFFKVVERRQLQLKFVSLVLSLSKLLS